MVMWRPPDQGFPDLQKYGDEVGRFLRRWGAARVAGTVVAAVLLVWLAETYERIFANGATIVLRPDSDLLRYLETPRPRR